MICVECMQAVVGAAVVVSENQAVHGTCHARWAARRIGRTFDCPKCRTTKRIDDLTRPIHKTVPSDGYDGWFASDRVVIAGYQQKACDLCDGIGFLEKEPKPITAQTGWTK